MERMKLDITWKSLWRVLFFVALALLMFKSVTILVGLFLAIVISSGLEFIVNFLERRGIPRTIGVILVFVGMALIVIIGIYTILPLLIVDLNTAIISFNKLAKNSWWGAFIKFPATNSVNQLVNKISDQLFSSNSSPMGAVSGLFGSMALTFSILISAFYLSLTHDGVERFIRTVLPRDYEEKAIRIFTRARKRIGFWFRTQILLSVLVGVLVSITLAIMGVRHALLLGLIAAIFEIVPFIGPILAGGAAVVSALITSPALGLYTFIAFVVIHQVESHILVPFLIGRNVGLHPVVVIISILIGLELGGFLGALAAVPMVVLLQEIIEGWSGGKAPDTVPLPNI